MFLKIIKAEYIGDFKIKIWFNNGRVGIADLKDELNEGIFVELKDLEKFKDFKLDNEIGTIVWQDEIDIAPEYLYFLAFKEEYKVA